jgi:hypothetical protein
MLLHDAGRRFTASYVVWLPGAGPVESRVTRIWEFAAENLG